MRVLLASDIHGRVQAVKKLENLFSMYRPDKIILLGDYLYNGPRNGVPSDYDPMAVCNCLNRFASKVIGIRGNCDSRVDEMLLKFPIIDSRVLYINGYRCDLMHGDLPISNLFEVNRGDILMFGHTHVYKLGREDGVVHFNPGSVSFPKMGNPATYGLMEGNHLEIRRLDDFYPVASLDLN